MVKTRQVGNLNFHRQAAGGLAWTTLSLKTRGLAGPRGGATRGGLSAGSAARCSVSTGGNPGASSSRRGRGSTLKPTRASHSDLPHKPAVWEMLSQSLTHWGRVRTSDMCGERENQLSRSSLHVPLGGEGLSNMHEAQSRGGEITGLQTLALPTLPHHRRPSACGSCHQTIMATLPQNLPGTHKDKKHNLKNKQQNQSDMAGVVELSNQRILKIAVNMLRVSWKKRDHVRIGEECKQRDTR